MNAIRVLFVDDEPPPVEGLNECCDPNAMSGR